MHRSFRAFFICHSERSEESIMRPTTFRAGDTYSWEESFPDYSATLYSAKASIIGAGGFQTFNGAGSGTTYTFTPTITATLPAGQYRLAIWVQLTSDAAKQRTQFDIPITLLANYADAAAPSDTRSSARMALDALNAAIQSAVLVPYSQLAAHMRTIGYRDLKEMFDARDRLKAEVMAEEYDAVSDTPTGIAYGSFVKV
jgi:hypothetical protein